jgi:FG-GAP-like repeat
VDLAKHGAASGLRDKLSLGAKSMMRITKTPFAIALGIAVVVMIPVHIAAAALGTLAPAGSGAGNIGQASPLMVTGDFNRDGIADMAEIVPPPASDGPSSLIVSLGQPDGTFKPVASNPAVGRDPRSIIVGDFNGDGDPDLIVGDGDGSLIELLGDGTGNLVPSGEVGRVGSVASIAVGDFNRDGHLDLAISDPHANSVAILLGDGNGSFRPAWSFPLPMKGAVFHLAAADFNADGIIDLAITSADDDEYEIMLGNGNGTFTYAPALSNVKDPNAYCPT